MSPRDLNEDLRRQLSLVLDRAHWKGVEKLDDRSITLVFEQGGRTHELHVHAEGGIDAWLTTR